MNAACAAIVEQTSLPVLDALRSLANNCGLKAGVSCAVGVVSWTLGGLDQLLATLAFLWAVDFALGFARACRAHRISSTKMKAGVLKILLYGVAIIVGHRLDMTMRIPLPLTLRDAIAMYLVLGEAISIFEHLTYFGVPLPQPIMKRLRVYRDNLCVKSEEEK